MYRPLAPKAVYAAAVDILLEFEDTFNTELATAAKAVELRNWERFGRSHVGRWQDSFAGYVPRTPLRVGWRDYGVPHTQPAGQMVE